MTAYKLGHLVGSVLGLVVLVLAGAAVATVALMLVIVLVMAAFLGALSILDLIFFWA